MQLDTKQQGALKGIVTGLGFSLLALTLAAYLTHDSFIELGPAARLVFVLKLESLPALWLAFSIGRLARHRFFTPEDIDGGGLSAGSAQARVYQAVLQNTLEQTTLAVLVHLVWAAVMPARWLGVIIAAVCLFMAGRILFTFGYASGAPARAFGFALTFYPSVIMLVTVLIQCLKMIADS